MSAGIPPPCHGSAHGLKSGSDGGQQDGCTTRAFALSVSRPGDHRFARTPCAHALPGPGPGRALGLRHRRRVPAGAGRLLARPLRLARAGGAAQRLSPVQGAAARHRPAFPARARARARTRCPLLLLHGWPGSVFEFLELIPRLTDPARFGGDPADAFTVVAPSLPGYGLSFAPGQPRFGVEEIADCFAELMTDMLGYARFAAQGGDWGAFVTARARLRACATS